MNMTQSEAVLLSLLGPRPVFWYEESADCFLCSWNGVKMTQEHALMLIAEFFWGHHPSPEMKRIADRKFYLLYRSGVFEDSEKWGDLVESHAPFDGMYSWYKKYMLEHVKQKLHYVTPKEAYSWLDLGSMDRMKTVDKDDPTCYNR